MTCTESQETQSTAIACRPRDHLIAFGKKYPNAWKQADELRASRGNGLPDWPDWCFLPLAGWQAIAQAGNPLQWVLDIGQLGAMGTWRVTQGIYRFDTTLLELVVSTPIDGGLPYDVLYRLPEWCVYIETPGMKALGSVLHGFFAHLESDSKTGDPELRLLLDTDENLIPIPIHLGEWSLNEALHRAYRQAANNVGPIFCAPYLTLADKMQADIEPLVSLLLYLCSENAEIGDGSCHPIKAVPVKTKKGPRLFAPNQSTTWEVGVRLGSALRRAQSERGSGNCGNHNAPRPHIRRAHWHGFRRGPTRNADGTPIKKENRRFFLRWLPPIPVNFENPEELAATNRPIVHGQRR